MFFKIINGMIAYGADVIFEQIDLDIRNNEKVAIVGRNGSGKTTLLKTIVGEVEVTEGIGADTFSIKSHGIDSIGYLKQITFDDDSISLVDEIRKVYAKVINLEKEIDEVSELMKEDHSLQMINRYSNLMEEFERLDGYSYKKEYETAIAKFGFDEEEKHRPLSAFSGGQRTKIALIKLLLSKPDLLLLDEPTNNLDLPTVEWLESYLKNYKKTMILISHDRMFLDNIVNVVYEIEYGALKRYEGNYTSFFRQREENYEKLMRDSVAQKKEIERLNHLIDRFIYKPKKAPFAKSLRKRLERMEIINTPRKMNLKSFHTQIEPAHRSALEVLVTDNLAIGYDNKTFQTVTMRLERGEKIAIIGPNGTGKTTFVKTIMGLIPKIKGRYFIGDSVEIGYFDQVTASMKINLTLYDEFQKEYPSLTPQETRDYLGAFQFIGDDVFKTVSALSGGEKVRFALALLLKKKPNFLILDEPTNHMDVVGKETLESMLLNYSGTVLVISHDRYFVNKIANKLLIFEKDKVTYFDGRYSEYDKRIQMLDNKPKAKPKVERPIVKDEEQMAKNTQKEIKRLETKITELENEINDLRELFNHDDVANDYQKCMEVDTAINEKEDKMTELLNELDGLI